MAVNADKPKRWNEDTLESVDMYNEWFYACAPKAFQDSRFVAAKEVKSLLDATDHLRKIDPKVLTENPEIIKVLRMSTAPPIARDRLIGLSGVPSNFVDTMEDKNRIPPRTSKTQAATFLEKIIAVIQKLMDTDLFVWLKDPKLLTRETTERAATVVADRLCGAISDPIIRNAQEKRQLAKISAWLDGRGYKRVELSNLKLVNMRSGTYAFHYGVPCTLDNGDKVDVSVDVVIKRKDRAPEALPLLIEAKSAGDSTNVNKRRKEEATKMQQLRNTLGEDVEYILFLCGYFDSQYLGYEAAEGLDWVWEHRIDDLSQFGV